MSSRPLIQGCNALGLCNLTLGEESPTFIYSPTRDGLATDGWNASYTGSTTYVPFSNGVGTPYRITRLNGAGLELDFQGTAVYLCLAMSSGVNYTLTVDGQQYNTTAPPTDAACYGDVGVQMVAYADGLSSKTHSANLSVHIPDPGAALSFYGGVVTLDVASAGTNISNPIYIDDSNPGWTYGNPVTDPSGWDHNLGDPTNINGTHSFTCTRDPASTATYTVESGAEALFLIGTPDANTYAYTISLDNTEYVYNASNLFAHDRSVLFFANGLDPTQPHTITATNYDANDPLGQGPGIQQCLSIDALVVMNSTSSAAASTTTTSTMAVSSPTQSAAGSTSLPSAIGGISQVSGGAIAGIVIGVLVALILIGASVWLLRRRSKARTSPNEARFSMVSPSYQTRNLVPMAYTLSNGEEGAAGMAEVSSLPSSSPISQPPRRSKGGLNSARSASDLPVIEINKASMVPELQQASTFDLVQVLNQRLRNEQVDNIEEPPVYETA